MPGKSRHSRGKSHPQSKKGKAKQRSAGGVIPQQAAAQVSKPAASLSVSATSVSAPTPTAIPGAARYPYITAELRRIGILAGIVLIILIVLALILS
ncbi:hypothetical protein ACFLVN_02240 [Chloroflexota bacterium]